MKMKRNVHALSWILCMVLIVAMALFTSGCSGKAEKTAETAAEIPAESAAEHKAETGMETDAETGETEPEMTVLGEGSRQFIFSVADLEGKETLFEIHTDETLVGAALQAAGLLEGEDGPYGLYVKTVNGVTADFDKDKTYWAFYVNGEYGTTGVDTTEIREGDVYSFRISK